MRRSVLLALCVASLLGGASTARARALSWMGEMTLDLGRFGKITQEGSGVAMVASTAGGNLNTLRLSGGITVGDTTLAITVNDPGFISATQVTLTATLGTGTLRGFATSEYRMLDRRGETRWFRDEAVLVRDPAGHPVAWRGVAIDITASRVVIAAQSAKKEPGRPRPVDSGSEDRLRI